MRARFAKAFKGREDEKRAEILTPSLVSAANTVRLILVKKEYADLLNKEVLSCLMATD